MKIPLKMAIVWLNEYIESTKRLHWVHPLHISTKTDAISHLSLPYMSLYRRSYRIIALWRPLCGFCSETVLKLLVSSLQHPLGFAFEIFLI